MIPRLCLNKDKDKDKVEVIVLNITRDNLKSVNKERRLLKKGGSRRGSGRGEES